MLTLLFIILGTWWEAVAWELIDFKVLEKTELYSYEPSTDTFSKAISLPPDTEIRFALEDEIEVFFQKRPTWYYGVSVERMNGVSDLSSLNRKQLFFSKTEMEKLKRKYVVRDEKGLPAGYQRIRLKQTRTIRELRGNALVSVADLPRGSEIGVNRPNNVGRMRYRNGAGRSVMSRFSWIQGVVVLDARGSLSRGEIRRINAKKLYVSEEILGDERPSRGTFRCNGSTVNVLLTGYAPREGGINGRCGRSASGLDACQYTLEDYLARRSQWVMVAVPQTHSHWWKRKIYIDGVKDRGRLIPFRAMDRYGRSSNNKNKMDICHERSRGEWFRRLQGIHRVCIERS